MLIISKYKSKKLLCRDNRNQKNLKRLELRRNRPVRRTLFVLFGAESCKKHVVMKD